ncbi:hypothetical protein IV203_037192 [Nitzschia inconspicua]|uniref:Uncharacterized protein n=1 Tax=Nitzschia inconspicua TaxID=303405 RepID=A0A9K3LLG0_9STRA|nr:hypothetical protein IV203_037192 [Nitzschia inconspicua]
MPLTLPFLTSDGIQPPVPDSEKSSGNNGNKIDASGLVDEETVHSADTIGSHPRRLLSLVRSLDKKNGTTMKDDEYDDMIQETVHLLNHLIAVYSRCGLLQGNTRKAQQILSSSSSSSTLLEGNNNQKRNHKKQKKHGSNTTTTNELQIKNDSAAMGNSSSQSLPDETLIFTAILRVLPSSQNDITSAIPQDDYFLMIGLVCELCVAITQHVRLDDEPDTCSLAVYELLAQHGKSILTGLVAAIQRVEVHASLREPANGTTSATKTTQSQCLTLLPAWDLYAQPFHSAFKAASVLVCLFGTKLSRSTALLQDLQSLSLRFLTISNDLVQETAAKLMACLTLTGGTDGMTPSDLWNIQFSGALTTLSSVLDTMAPLADNHQNTTRQSSAATNGTCVQLTVNAMLKDWIQFVRQEVADQSSRLQCFYRFSAGIVKLINALLLRPNLSGSNSSTLMLVGTQIDVQAILELVEAMVSFPLSAESVYYKTQRRMRDEVLENGLLSPRILASQVSNHIKLMGLEILESCLASVRGPQLIPYARRIIRIGYASVLTSCSSYVRNVMDPTNVTQLQSKKRRWLHRSIATRSRSIQMFGKIVVLFGYDHPGKSAGRSRQPSTLTTDCDRAIALIAGCLIEQMNNKKEENEVHYDWGTDEECAKLIEVSFESLRAAVTSFAGFLPILVRKLIESVVTSSLFLCSDGVQNSNPVMSLSSLKVEILNLGLSCATTPWNDGTSSPLTTALVKAAKQLEIDSDATVCKAARAVLCVCDTLQIPRAPALLYISRVAEAQGDILDASTIEEKLAVAKEDAVRERIKEEKKEQLKAKSAIDLKRKLKHTKNSEADLKRSKVFQTGTEGLMDTSTNMMGSGATLQSIAAPVQIDTGKIATGSETQGTDGVTASSGANELVQASGGTSSQGDVEPMQNAVEADTKVNDEDKAIRGADSTGQDEEDADLPDIFAGGGPDIDDEM